MMDSNKVDRWNALQSANTTTDARPFEAECEASVSSMHNTWTPPTPPTSSSPLRIHYFDASQVHDQLPSRTHNRGSQSGSLRQAKPLTTHRLASASAKLKRGRSDQIDLAGTSTLQSGRDWHSRFTLQCAERARGERQRTIDEQRNGLRNDVIRSDFETREEMAVFRRLALKEKHARESEADRILREEYECMLHSLEQQTDAMPDSVDMPVSEDQYIPEDILEEERQSMLPDEEEEMYSCQLMVPQSEAQLPGNHQEFDMDTT